MPGQEEISYRVGTYNQFKESMISSISEYSVLRILATREESKDIIVALFSSCAKAYHILSRYTEINANEGFLQTARERRSLLELASATGHKPSRGLAASGHISFILESADGSSKKTIINKGTKVQSVPTDGEMPEIFETTEKIEASSSWNDLKLVLTQSQEINNDTNTIYIENVSAQLKEGDYILIVTVTKDMVSGIVDTGSLLRTVSRVTTDTIKQITQVDLLALSLKTEKPEDITPDISVLETRVFALRIKCGIFGNNAPNWKALGTELQKAFANPDEPTPQPINKKRTPKTDGYDESNYGEGGKLIYLDNVYSTLIPSEDLKQSWVVFLSPSGSDLGIPTALASKVLATREETVMGFATSARSTGLVLDLEDVSKLSKFTIRNTTVYAQSEELTLAKIPKQDPIEKNTIELREVVPHISTGRLVSITGEIIEEGKKLDGSIQSEVAEVAEARVEGNHTKIIFEHDLLHKYNRQKVTLNANVAKATHGQTKELVLGGGDPSQYFQEFVIREKPLTYVSAPTASGVHSTLEVFVDGVKWNEVQSFYDLGPNDHAYITRTDEDLQTHVIFGDGIRGMRPSAGLDNIKAKYRVGIGEVGLLKANQLTTLMDRAAHVKSCTNNTPTFGAANQESIEDLRENIPLSVLTNGRSVSITDYASFARTSAGIGKTHATWIWDGQKKIVYLTILSATGTVIDPSSDVHKNLIDAINNNKDPIARFRLGTPILKKFTLSAGIIVSNGYRFDDVKSEVKEVLSTEFSFAKRECGQNVSIAEVISTIQNVDGVEVADLDYLFFTGETPKLNRLLRSQVAHWDNTERKVISAELVTIYTEKGPYEITINNIGNEK